MCAAALSCEVLGHHTKLMIFLVLVIWSVSGNADCWMCSSAAPVRPFSLALLQVAWGGDSEHSGSGSGVAACKFPGSVVMS